MAKLIPAPPIVGPPAPPNVTAVTMSGPVSGVINTASSNFNIGVNPVGGLVSGTVTVIPSSNGGGGTFTPTSVLLTTGSPTGSFTYTPNSNGTKTISVSNNGSLANPSNISYAVTGSASVPNAPVIGFAQTGYSYVDVYFNAPSIDGGSSIIDYYAVLSTGESATGTGSPIRINVPNGASRSATVRARNGMGNSAFSSSSNTVTPPPTNVIFNGSQTWVAPTGVTNLIVVTGKGQNGTPGTSGTAGPPVARSTVVANVVYSTNNGGDIQGVYYWNSSKADADNAVYILNSGGSGTFTTTSVAVYKESRFGDPAGYTVSQSYYGFSNAIPNSASLSTFGGWQNSGKVLSSGSATVSWQEYGDITPGTPATTGANTVGFGITWTGGVGGTAPTATYNNISVTPGASYGVTVPSGGSIIITY